MDDCLDATHLVQDRSKVEGRSPESQLARRWVVTPEHFFVLEEGWRRHADIAVEPEVLRRFPSPHVDSLIDVLEMISHQGWPKWRIVFDFENYTQRFPFFRQL